MDVNVLEEDLNSCSVEEGHKSRAHLLTDDRLVIFDEIVVMLPERAADSLAVDAGDPDATDEGIAANEPPFSFSSATSKMAANRATATQKRVFIDLA